MTVWSDAAVKAFDSDGRVVPTPDDRAVVRYGVRWRVDGASRRRSFPATQAGRADARRLVRELQTARDRGLPAGPDGLPVFTPVAAAPPLDAVDATRGSTPTLSPHTVESWAAHLRDTEASEIPNRKTRDEYIGDLDTSVRLAVYPPDDPRGPAGHSMNLAHVEPQDAQRITNQRAGKNFRHATASSTRSAPPDATATPSEGVGDRAQTIFLQKARWAFNCAVTLRPEIANNP